MISDERLQQIARGEWICCKEGDIEAIAGELLDSRNAFSEPVAWIHQTTGAMLKNSVIEDVRKQSGVWIPLYRKPTDSTP